MYVYSIYVCVYVFQFCKELSYELESDVVHVWTSVHL